MKYGFWLALSLAALLAGCGDANWKRHLQGVAARPLRLPASKVMQSLPGELAGYLRNLNAPVSIDLGRFY